MSRCSRAPPKSDTEVSLNQADAHLINEDWMGGARVLKPLPGARAEERARRARCSAWALEAGGDLDGELEVRRSLSDDYPSTAHDRDYGRALERADSFPRRATEYERALPRSTSTRQRRW